MTTTPRSSAIIEQANRKRNAWRVLIVMAVAMVAFDVFSARNALAQGGIQYFSAGISFGMTVIVLVSMGLTYRNRVTLAMWLLIAGNLASLVAAAFLGGGLGLILAVVSVVIVSAIASQTLPARHVSRALVAAVVAGLAAYLLDVFGVAPVAASTLTNSTVTFTVLGGMLVVYGFILARQLPSYSLRTKLVLAFVTLTVVAVASLAYINDRNTRTNLTASVGSGLKAQADALSSAVSNRIVNRWETLRTFAVSRVLQDQVETANLISTDDQTVLSQKDQRWQAAADANDLDDSLVQSVLNNELSLELRKFQGVFREILEVMVTDKYGALIGASSLTADYYQADEEWWQGAYAGGKGEVYVSQPQFDENIRANVVLIAIPLYSPTTSQFAGVMRTGFQVISLLGLLTVPELGQTGHAELLFPDGQVLDPEFFGQMAEAEPDLTANLDRLTNATYAEFVYEDAPSVVSLARVGTSNETLTTAIAQLNWKVIVHQDEAFSLAPVEAQSRSAALVSVVITVLAGLAAVGLSQLLAAPIVQLTEVAARVREGDLTAQARVNTADEMGALAQTFNSMTTQLRQTLASLEQRVADRTRALAASAEVSRRLSTILEEKQLVSEVVEQVRSAFGYYHAQIYLFDEAREKLLMAGGTGEAGRVMLGRGHFISTGKGLVGWCAQINEPVLVPDVTRAEEWLPNPLLPDTKAEAAVPIALGGQVVGVLDVQHNLVNGLTQDDVDLLQSIANQVAVALRNARSYEEARVRAENEARVNVISQKIRAATSVDKVLEIAARELGQRLGARRASAQLGLLSRADRSQPD
jgi:putative methionine-R-sulfoxide reductase with GAF domain